MRQLIADGAVVDKSVYSKRKAFQWAEVNDTHATLTFAEVVLALVALKR